VEINNGDTISIILEDSMYNGIIELDNGKVKLTDTIKVQPGDMVVTRKIKSADGAISRNHIAIIVKMRE
jgi:hypothetical protein